MHDNSRRAVVMLLSSTLKILLEGNLCFTNTAPKLSKHPGTWTSLKHTVLRMMYISYSRVEKCCLLQKLISQSFPAGFPFVQFVFNSAPLRIIKGYVLITNEMHNSCNQFLFHSFLSALHVSNDSSRSSSAARHNILYNTVWYNRTVTW